MSTKTADAFAHWTALVEAAIESGHEEAASITATGLSAEEARSLAAEYAAEANDTTLSGHAARAIADDLTRYADEVEAMSARIDALLGR